MQADGLRMMPSHEVVVSLTQTPSHQPQNPLAAQERQSA